MRYLPYSYDPDDDPEPVERVYEVLDPSHCELCLTWASGLQPWWSDPDTVQGQAMIREILDHYEKGYEYASA